MRKYKPSETYACDFETTNQVPSRVWASIAVKVDESYEIAHRGTSIEDFMEWLKKVAPCKCYFHNLKHDAQAIIYYLLTNGFTYSEEPKEYSFNLLVSDVGAYYSLEILFNYSSSRHDFRRVKIWDSLKLFPMKLSVLAKAFNMPISKGEIDYNAPRSRGYQPTAEEWDYVDRDGLILARALLFFQNEGLTKMTIGSNALHNYKNIIGKTNSFRSLFPLYDTILDEDIRKAYRGGWTYLNPKYKNKGVKGGIVLDVNSLYPYVMYSSLLPIGYPVYFEGEPYKNINKDAYPLYIANVRVDFTLSSKGVPTIQDKSSSFFKKTEYITDSNGEIELWLTNVDIELLKENYDIYSFEIIKGYAFKGATGLFKNYIDKWIEVKKTSTGGMRQLAKLMLNSLYGKFATNPKSDIKVPYLDEETKSVKYRNEKKDERELVYTPMGVFITAYARAKTIRSAHKLKDRFIYADTDSLHLVGKEIPSDEWIDDKDLGAWKIEESFTDSYYIRAKTYVELLDDGTLKVTCAGMPDNVKAQVTLNNFREGATFHGKLLPKIVEGGVILKEVDFTISHD